jgi:hypothetical protein
MTAHHSWTVADDNAMKWPYSLTRHSFVTH